MLGNNPLRAVIPLCITSALSADVITISRSLRTFDQSDASSHQVTSSESMEIYIIDLIIAMYIEYGGV